MDILRTSVPAIVPRAAAIAVDGRVLALASLLGIATGLVFGVAPAVRFAVSARGATVFQGSRGSTTGTAVQRVRGLLVVSQIALAVVLLVGAGLFVASFLRVTRVPLGFSPEGVLSVRIRPLVGPEEAARARRENRDKLLRILDNVSAAPGVQSAALIGSSLPLRGDLRTVDFSIPGRTLPPGTDIALNEITPAYLSTMRIPVLRGRAFAADDRRGSEPVAILSEAAARTYFARDTALGAMVTLDQPRRVVGIVGNVRDEGPEHAERVQAYVPVAQRDLIGATLVMRTSSHARVLPAVRDAIWREFVDLPLPDQFTLDHYFEAMVAQRRFSMLLMGVFGLLAVVIAAAGIYGVMAYTVEERRREIGIRMAVGAAPMVVLAMILKRAGAIVTAGLLVGLPAAWLLSRALSSHLFEVQPHDPGVYVSVLIGLSAAAMTAALIPARRAARVDPAAALRSE